MAVELAEEPAIARLDLLCGEPGKIAAVTARAEILHVDEQERRLPGIKRNIAAERHDVFSSR